MAWLSGNYRSEPPYFCYLELRFLNNLAGNIPDDMQANLALKL